MSDLKAVPTEDLLAELLTRQALVVQDADSPQSLFVPPTPAGFFRRLVQPQWEDYTSEMLR